MLAGISVEYYVRLERGNVRGVSEDVLEGIARALQLDEGDRMHLFDLVRAINTAPGRRGGRRPAQEHVRPVTQRILDPLVGVPAFVQNPRLDVLAANRLGEAFYALQFADPTRPVNGTRFVFLDPRAKEFPRLGHHRQRLGWHPSCRGRSGSVRQAPRGPRRRALHPQRRVPRPLGRAPREAPPHRREALPPSAASPWTSRCSISLATRARGCSSTARSPVRRPVSGWTCSPAGRRHRQSRAKPDGDQVRRHREGRRLTWPARSQRGFARERRNLCVYLAGVGTFPAGGRPTAPSTWPREAEHGRPAAE